MPAGYRDSQGLLQKLVGMERNEQFADGILPKIHISGCPSSCGTHQIGVIGFRGGAKTIDKVLKPAFNLYINGAISGPGAAWEKKWELY